MRNVFHANGRLFHLQPSLQNVHALFITVRCVRIWKALEWKALAYQVTATFTWMCSMHVPEKSQWPVFPFYCVEGSVGFSPDWCFQHRMLKSAAWNWTLVRMCWPGEITCSNNPAFLCCSVSAFHCSHDCSEFSLSYLYPDLTIAETGLRSGAYHHPQNRNRERASFHYKPWRIYVGGTPRMNMLL